MNDHPLVTRLERLRDANDRAALAKLRRGLGKKGGTPEMYPYVVPFLPRNDDKDNEQYFLIASLFAMHPAPASRGFSMGKVFRAMSEGSSSVEKRFTNLLSVDIGDITGHLRQAVSLAKSKGVAVDYHQLIHDLKHWNRRDRRVQLNWARDFWGYEKSTEIDTQPKGDEQ